MTTLLAGLAVDIPATASAIANPASVFCGTMGGESVVAKLPSGDEIGLCYLAHDRIVEEWTLFHMFKGNKPANRDNPFAHADCEPF